MILPDVNVLLNAFRADAPDHGPCRMWLETVLNGPAPFGMSPLVLSAVVRIATHPRIFKRPSSLAESFAFTGLLLSRPRCVAVVPGRRHWALFEELCREVGLSGGDVTDAYFAALAVESGCEWVTLDRGYARFPGLRWSTPF